MNTVTIRRCPVCGSIREHAEKVQAALKNDPWLLVEVTDGAKGEFTVLVDDEIVAQKTGDAFPDVDDVVAAVHEDTHLGASAYMVPTV